MGDTSIYSQTNDGFKITTNYEQYLAQLKAELLGKRLEPKKVGTRTLPDGTTEDMYDYAYTEPNKEIQLVNEDGADYIVRNLRKVFNPHSSMGNIRTNQECARLAARLTQSIYAHIMANSSVYGCSEEKFSALEGEFDVTMISVYNFFTSMREGALMGFGKDTQHGEYKYETPEQQHTPLLGLGGKRQ